MSAYTAHQAMTCVRAHFRLPSSLNDLTQVLDLGFESVGVTSLPGWRFTPDRYNLVPALTIGARRVEPRLQSLHGLLEECLEDGNALLAGTESATGAKALYIVRPHKHPDVPPMIRELQENSALLRYLYVCLPNKFHVTLFPLAAVSCRRREVQETMPYDD